MAKKRKTNPFRRRASRAVTKTRTVYRAARRSARRGYSRGRSSGWLPLSMKESAVSFGVGAISPKVNELVAPYTDGVLSFAGDYKDEARTALIGVVAHKFGSGLVKDAGREMFRAALLSAGNETGRRFIGGGSVGGGVYN